MMYSTGYISIQRFGGLSVEGRNSHAGLQLVPDLTCPPTLGPLFVLLILNGGLLIQYPTPDQNLA